MKAIGWEAISTGRVFLPGQVNGDLGIGAAGAFDDLQRSYATVIREGPDHRLWYSGNGYGATGMDYAGGRLPPDISSAQPCTETNS